MRCRCEQQDMIIMNKKHTHTHTHKLKKMTKIAIVVAGIFALSSEVGAQVTSSSLRGQVVDTQGNPLSGVTVEVIHNYRKWHISIRRYDCRWTLPSQVARRLKL